MGFKDRSLAGYDTHSLGSLTLTGANETLRTAPVQGANIPLLQAKFLTEAFAPNDLVWVPVGIIYIVTTGITVTNAVVTLRKNGVNAATGGTATLPIVATGPNEIWSPFSNYTFAAADAIGDAWSVIVTTTSTAGVVNPIYLAYAFRAMVGITDGVNL